MQSKSLVLALALVLSGGTSLAQAGGWSVLPVTDAGFKAEPTLAIMGGMLNPDVSGADADTAGGVELSFNCLALQPSTGKLRTQISWSKYDDAGLEIESVELNPHYLVKVGEGLELGAGPGIGYVSGKTGAVDDHAWALQVGASAHYRAGKLFLGAEARYQFTQEEFADQDMDNLRVMLKVGYNF